MTDIFNLSVIKIISKKILSIINFEIWKNNIIVVYLNLSQNKK